MLYSALIVFTSALLLAVTVWTPAQKMLLWTIYRTLQLIVVASIVAFSTASLKPELVPIAIKEKIVSGGWADASFLEHSNFWFGHGLLVAVAGIVAVTIARHLCDVPQVCRHLSDIKTVVGNVSQKIGDARRTPAGQGAVRRAVETMAEFFKG